ncbi:serine/threonine-protein kinase ATR-like isoform X2 [Paramacrobiotus metropolitanus]|uniref:serine/threonine-protein kinase ATR-like isoform X2 n=1 Tax=Paramacrobiotus metropolitanus TaxID=2943436 RepID=UPI002445D76D|nr:serine/threonine-protein kinase ATR-like isoform X2 [Paramacrobiotus metropolitanus]
MAANGMDWYEHPVDPEDVVPAAAVYDGPVADAAVNGADENDSLVWPDELDRSFGSPMTEEEPVAQQAPTGSKKSPGATSNPQTKHPQKVRDGKRASLATVSPNHPSESRKTVKAFIDSAWDAIRMRDGVLASSSVLELYKELRKLMERPNTRESMVKMIQQMVAFLPPITDSSIPDRASVMNALSDFYHRYSVEMSDGVARVEITDEIQRDLLDILRFIMPCTHPDDNMTGQYEVLLEAHFSENPLVMVSATQCLTFLGEVHKQPLPRLFAENAPLYGAVLAVMFLGESEQDIKTMVTTCLRMYRLSGTVQDCLRLLTPFLFKALLLDGSEEAREEMRHLARVYGSSLEKHLSEFLELFLPQLLVDAPTPEVLERGLSIVEEETHRTRLDLLAAENHWVYHKIFLNLSEKPDDVMRAILFLANVQGHHFDTRSEVDLDALASYIEPRFLGFFFEADRVFKDPESSLKARRKVLLSLAQLIKFMGPQRTSAVRSKLLATLKTVLQTAPVKLQPACFDAWTAFVETLEVAALKPILCEIVIIITPFVHTCCAQVVALLEHLVRQDKLRNHLPENLYTLVSNSDQRQQHLQATSGDVQGQQEIVVKLLNALVAGCRDAHVMAERRSFAEVLGCIGALDPDFVEIPEHCDTGSRLLFNIHQKEFACSFLKELAKGYVTAEKTSIQDHCGFVIQEALKFYHLNEDYYSTQDFDTELWELLGRGQDYRETLEPFRKTKYTYADDELTQTQLAVPSGSTAGVPRPVFGTQGGAASFSMWMRQWTVNLIDSISCQTETANFFRKCGKLLLDDLNRCVILLPHIVAYLLLFESPPVADSIRTEIVTVLESHERDLHLNMQQYATYAVMDLLDFLNQFSYDKGTVTYVRRERMHLAPEAASATECKKLVTLRIRDFLGSISEESMAKACFSCGTYAKALQHYENFIRQKDSTMLQWRGNQEQVDFLQTIYVSLNEADGIRGVNDCRTSAPSIEDLVVRHRSSGAIQDALTCYQQLVQAKLTEDSPSAAADLAFYNAEVARCLLDLDQPAAAMSFCDGLLDDNADWMGELNPLRIEAAWKLAEWGALERYLDDENQRYVASSSSQWNVGVGRLLLAVKQQSNSVFWEVLQDLQGCLMGPICQAGIETQAYHKAYDHLVLLHVLQEIEEAAITWFGITPDPQLQIIPKTSGQLLVEWGYRMDNVQPSYSNMQRILTVRRLLLEATERADVRMEMGMCLVQNAKMARKFHHLQTAYSLVLSAMPLVPIDAAREHAKFLWAKGEREAAIDSLKRVVQVESFASLDKGMQARMKLLTARYLDESQTVSGKELMDRYSDVVVLAPEIEKSHFYLGHYHDRALEAMEKNAGGVSNGKTGSSLEERGSRTPLEERPVWVRLETEGEQMLKVMKEYISALSLGCRFIHQCLPRLLGLWLDFGAAYQKVCQMKRGKLQSPTVKLQQIFEDAQAQMRRAIKEIPKYVFLVAFPQLISRICNINEEVFVLLMELIVTVSRQFPQIAMWHLAPVCRSKKLTRNRRYKRIMEYMKMDKNNIDVNRFFTKMEEFLEQCEMLCNLQVPGRADTALLTEFPETKRLVRLLEDTSWLHPLLPFRAFMTPALLSSRVGGGREAMASHNAFPMQPVTICRIENDFSLLNSLQRPKRITIIDSDGRSHDLLLKPKDDLRKDSRFMELVELVNKYLRQNAECHRRQLHVRGYAVVPLSEENGIIEWVPNVRPLRQIIMEGYKKHLKIDLRNSDIVTFSANRYAPIEERLRLLDTMNARYKPVLHLWLSRQFPEASVYYASRLMYARSCAVMSIVGYMMGLGDRHCENIMLDQATALTMHCDFSCLFNKGEALDWPERVPFRLTQNLVDAMGPLGVEGFFREACELTLSVIREQKASLISVLKTFLYDPLVEWQSSGSGGNNRNESGETQNQDAVECLERIQQRIHGHIVQLDLDNVGTGSGSFAGRQSAALSVKGQVSYLIREATCPRLLCQMYVGWSPFM